MATTKRSTKRTTKKAAPVAEVKETVVKETVKETAPSTVCVCLNYPLDVKYRVPDKNGKLTEWTFYGSGHGLKGLSKGIIPTGEYGFTPNVPKEVWDYIVKTRPDEKLIKNGNMFVASQAQSRAAAKERAEIRHGFEPVKPLTAK